MKSLVLMRHAKSGWPSEPMADFDRTLNDRGKTDAPEMASRMLKKGFTPQQIVSSPAKRALKTAKLVAAKLGYDEKNIDRQFDIYEAEINTLVHVIRSFDDSYDKVMMVGHNPGFTGLVGFLSDQLIENLPTSGIVLIEFDVKTWKQVAQKTGTLKWFDFPKNS